MNENLTKRKAGVKKYLEEQFKEIPQKWWQFKSDDYTPTWEVDSGKVHHPHHREETIVKYDYKRALKSSALFLFFSFLMGVYVLFEEGEFPVSFFGMGAIFILIAAFQLLNKKKKGLLMLFDKKGFWIKGMSEQVSWEHLVASYIRTNHSGENPSYYILLYYYDKTKDEFSETEYCLAGLDMSKEDIASQIEYWKIIAGTVSIAV